MENVHKPSPTEQREGVQTLLTAYVPQIKYLGERVLRAGDVDAALKQEWAEGHAHLDFLLDEWEGYKFTEELTAAMQVEESQPAEFYD